MPRSAIRSAEGAQDDGGRVGPVDGGETQRRGGGPVGAAAAAASRASRPRSGVEPRRQRGLQALDERLEVPAPTAVGHRPDAPGAGDRSEAACDPGRHREPCGPVRCRNPSRGSGRRPPGRGPPSAAATSRRWRSRSEVRARRRMKPMVRAAHQDGAGGRGEHHLAPRSERLGLRRVDDVGRGDRRVGLQAGVLDGLLHRGDLAAQRARGPRGSRSRATWSRPRVADSWSYSSVKEVTWAWRSAIRFWYPSTSPSEMERSCSARNSRKLSTSEVARATADASSGALTVRDRIWSLTGYDRHRRQEAPPESWGDRGRRVPARPRLGSGAGSGRWSWPTCPRAGWTMSSVVDADAGWGSARSASHAEDPTDDRRSHPDPPRTCQRVTQGTPRDEKGSRGAGDLRVAVLVVDPPGRPVHRGLLPLAARRRWPPAGAPAAAVRPDTRAGGDRGGARRRRAGPLDGREPAGGAVEGVGVGHDDALDDEPGPVGGHDHVREVATGRRGRAHREDRGVHPRPTPVRAPVRRGRARRGAR